jgi:hypothetical protein
MASTTVIIDPIAISTITPSASSTPSPAHSSTQPVVEPLRISPAPSLRPSLSWTSIRSRISVSERTSAQLGWAVAFLSVLLTIVTLSPAFKSQNLSEKAYRLAEWTALKDFIEECREELAAGIQSQVCLRVADKEVPPPPYLRPGVLDKIKRREAFKGHHWNGTSTRYEQADILRIRLPNALLILLGLGIAFVACSLFLTFKTARSRTRRHSTTPSRQKVRPPLISIPSEKEVPITKSSIVIRHPPSPSDTTLRRRPIRNHPIYRYANLEEAIHEEDMSEIRTRLQNGEDVNQHWPYLIYRLAITPPAMSTMKRLEIARLCLDFGADVNALKGWNGQSALMIAIHFGNVDVAKLLIVNGARVSYSPADSNLTALHRCVRLAVTGSAADALEIMRLLFAYGADANQGDRLGETPLHKLLVDAWLSRDDELATRKLEPIALCLLENRARVPETIKDKYRECNPLWDIVRSNCWVIERRGSGGRMERVGRGSIEELRGEEYDGRGTKSGKFLDTWFYYGEGGENGFTEKAERRIAM